MKDIEPIDWEVACEDDYIESHNSCEDYNNIDL